MKAAEYTLVPLYRLRLWRALCLALTMLLITSTALAAQPLTGRFKGTGIGRRVQFRPPNRGFVRNWAGVLYLQLDQITPGDGLGPLVPVFCIQVNVLVRVGDLYKSAGPVTDIKPGGCQIRYLLDKYPASTAGTADEAAARQLAIWHFSDDVDLTTIQDAVVRPRAIALADEAVAAVALNGCPGTQSTVVNLTLDPPTANVVPGQAVNYTVRVDPPNAAPSVDIAVNGTATLPNGQQQITLALDQGVATFSVLNPVEGTSTVTARLPYVLDAGTVFEPIDAGHPTQRLVMGERVSLTASASVQAVWGAPTATPTTGPTLTPTQAPTVTPTTAAPTITPTSKPPPKPKPPAPAPETPAAPSATPTAAPDSPPGRPSAPTPGGETPGGETPGGETPEGSSGPDLTPPAGSGTGTDGGAGGTIPSRLPNTGAPVSPVGTPFLVVAGLMLACGLLLRERGRGR